MNLVDGYTLAAYLGVRPATVRQWARRGRIGRRGYDRRGLALYDAQEVVEREPRHALKAT